MTAAEALSYCADLLVQLQGRRLGSQIHVDDDGDVRVVSPDRDLRYYLYLTCAQVRRYGREEPTVLTAVLRLLRDMAASARDDAQRHDIAEQSALWSPRPPTGCSRTTSTLCATWPAASSWPCRRIWTVPTGTGQER